MEHQFFLPGCTSETGQNIGGRSFAFGSISRNGVLWKFLIIEVALVAWWLFVGCVKQLLGRSTCIVMCWELLSVHDVLEILYSWFADSDYLAHSGLRGLFVI